MKWLRSNLAHMGARLVLILMISVFLIILTVSLTSYYVSKSVLQEELSEPQRQLLQLDMNMIDDSIREADQAAIQVALNGSVYDFFTSPKQGPLSIIKQVYQLLTTLIDNNRYVKSIYVYDMARDSFVALPQGYSSSKMNFVDSEWVGVAGEFGQKRVLIKKRQVPEGAGTKGSELTLFRKIMIQDEFKGIAAVNLKFEELFAKLNAPSIKNLHRIRYILDGDGSVLYSASNYRVDHEAILQALGKLENGRKDLNFKRRKMLVNQLESPVTGWKYISVVEQDSLLAKSRKIRDAVLGVSLAALVLGVLTIRYINAVAFRPVRRLRQLFKTYGPQDLGNGPGGPDLEKLAGELLNNHAHLAHLVRETISEASSKFLYDIHIGHLACKRDIQEKWTRYFAEWTDEPVSAVILSIDRYESFVREFSASDRSLLKFALANITAELFEPEWRIVCADFGNDKTAILLQLRHGQGAPENKLMEAIGVAGQLLKLSVSAGLSMPQADCTRLKQSLLEAENALTYRLYQGYGKVISFREVAGHEVEEPIPVDGLLEELIIAALQGDEKSSEEHLHRMIEDIRGWYGYPSAALAYLQAAAERVGQLGTGDEGALEARFVTLKLEDIRSELLNRVRSVSRSFRKRIESKDFILCHRMIDYMKQHLGETIGIPEIAESIKASSSLASQIFKQETGKTIYNYLTRIRMDRAAELLLKSDYKIAEIARMVGYQHENSFIRSFRKVKDVTPGKYRDVMKFQ
nr:AraC family transcriptional regulator [Paenibacillus oralis]